LYFGKHGDKVLDIDRLFGSAKFSLGPDHSALDDAAKSIIGTQIDVASFDQRAFLKRGTDVIAIDKDLSKLMRQRWQA
jgi:hypothetical protein